MCIIIDTNTFSAVFDGQNAKHEEFKPVLDWIIKGKGKIIYGGSKYLKELAKANKTLKILSIINSKSNKVIIADRAQVDQEEKRIHSLIPLKDFDDPHLAAIVSVSRCRLICSGDARSVNYVTRPNIYPKGVIAPKYYTGERNKALLSDEYIDDRYKPLDKCNKATREIIESVLPSIANN